MAYETLPPNAPSFTADITASLIKRVHNNPFHPTAETVRWPANYDEFVRKTNEAMSAVMVSDETGKLVDILTGSLNAFHLQHIPQRGTAISVSDGVLDDSLTNWQQGIVFFSTLPSADDFVFTYMAQPDRYYGEYLTQMMDVLHKMEDLWGAGSTEGEGLKNAVLPFITRSTNLGARFPHSQALDALTRDLTIQGVTSQGLRLGSGQDIVEVRAQRFRVRGDQTGSNVDMFFGWNTGDYARFAGNVDVTGDLTVLGDLIVTGSQIINGGTTIINTQIAQTKLVSEFETILGITTSSKTYMGGDADVTGEFRHLGVGDKNAKFDRNIELTDGALRGVTHEGKVDGLNPSTVELHRPFYRADYREGYLNRGYQKGLFTGNSTNTGLGTLVDSGLAAALTTDPNWFDQRLDDGDYVATILAHPNASSEVGRQIPIVSFDGVDTLTLSRNLDGAGPNVEFVVHHRYAEPDVVRAGSGLSVTINADAARAAVGNRDGRYKSRRSSTSVLSLPDDSTVYVYMKTVENANEIEEDEPSFFYRTHKIQSDEDVLLARVVTASGNVTTVVNFRLNGRYDSGWIKQDALGGSVLAEHYLGSRERTLRACWCLEWADDTGGGPGLPNFGVPADTGHFRMTDLQDEDVTVQIPDTGFATPLWFRLRTC